MTHLNFITIIKSNRRYSINYHPLPWVIGSQSRSVMHTIGLPLTSDLRPIIEFDKYVRRRFASSAKWYDGAAYSTTAWGWRGNEDTSVKSARKKRILVIGDSFAENYQKSWEKSIPVMIANHLNKFFECEVYSIGMRGFNLLDYYKLVQHESSRFDPDLIIILVFTFNDFKPYLVQVCKPVDDDIVFTNLSESQKEFELYIDAPDCKISKSQLARALSENRVLTRTGPDNITQYSLKYSPLEYLTDQRKKLLSRFSRRNNYIDRVIRPGLQIYEITPDEKMCSAWALVRQILRLLANRKEAGLHYNVGSVNLITEQVYPKYLRYRGEVFFKH